MPRILESAIEVGQIGKARVSGDHAYRSFCSNQPHAGTSDAQAVQVVGQILTKVTHQQPVERSLGDVSHRAKIPHSKWFRKSLMHHVQDPVSIERTHQL
jgi:hypothetical protein